jgi:ArsR family transcriptional regulator
MDVTSPARSVPVVNDACSPVPIVSRLDTRRANQLAGQIKALADPTRLRMLDLLARQAQPLCVCEITPLFDRHQPTISHHLRILREAGMIDGEKRGVWAYYWATEQGKRSLALVETLA